MLLRPRPMLTMERKMTVFTKSFATALALCAAATTAAVAQDATTTPAAPAAPTAPAAPAAPGPVTPPLPAKDGAGAPYFADPIGDWQMQCFRTEAGKKTDKDPCQLYQLLKDKSGTPIADISMVALQPGGKAIAGATIMTPLETLLTQNVVLKIDDGEAKMYPFTFCAQMGCFARVGLTADDLAAFKKGKSVSLTIVPVSAPDKPVTVDMSLKGFTNAFDAVTKNAQAVAAAQKATK